MVLQSNWLAFLLVLWGIILCAHSLEPHETFGEGPCIRYKKAGNFDMRWFTRNVDSFKYVSAGNQYSLFGVASFHPDYSNLREDEFFYGACIRVNINFTSETTTLHAFNRHLGTFQTKLDERRGAIDFIPYGAPENTITMTPTLTDNKSFVFFGKCWKGTNQRAWSLFTTVPRLDVATQRKIEAHAVSLGFNKRQFIFLRYETCPRHNPFNTTTTPRPTTPAPRGRGKGDKSLFREETGFGWGSPQ